MWKAPVPAADFLFRCLMGDESSETRTFLQKGWCTWTALAQFCFLQGARQTSGRGGDQRQLCVSFSYTDLVRDQCKRLL